MKRVIFFISVLFVMLTGFNQQERVVEQSNVDFLGRASVEVEKPVITQELMHLSVNEGGIATFIVRFAPSDCEVTWLKDGIPMKEGDFINLYRKDGKATLVIDMVITRDAGEYKVVITNAAGKVESTAVLTVRME